MPALCALAPVFRGNLAQVLQQTMFAQECSKLASSLFSSSSRSPHLTCFFTRVLCVAAATRPRAGEVFSTNQALYLPAEAACCWLPSSRVLLVVLHRVPVVLVLRSAAPGTVLVLDPAIVPSPCAMSLLMSAIIVPLK